MIFELENPVRRARLLAGWDVKNIKIGALLGDTAPPLSGQLVFKANKGGKVTPVKPTHRASAQDFFTTPRAVTLVNRLMQDYGLTRDHVRSVVDGEGAIGIETGSGAKSAAA